MRTASVMRRFAIFRRRLVKIRVCNRRSCAGGRRCLWYLTRILSSTRLSFGFEFTWKGSGKASSGFLFVKVTPHGARTVSVPALETSAELKPNVYLPSSRKLVRCRWSVRFRTLDKCKTALLSQRRFQFCERFDGNVLSGGSLPPGSPVSIRPLAGL